MCSRFFTGAPLDAAAPPLNKKYKDGGPDQRTSLRRPLEEIATIEWLRPGGKRHQGLPDRSGGRRGRDRHRRAGHSLRRRGREQWQLYRCQLRVLLPGTPTAGTAPDTSSTPSPSPARSSRCAQRRTGPASTQPACDKRHLSPPCRERAAGGRPPGRGDAAGWWTTPRAPRSCPTSSGRRARAGEPGGAGDGPRRARRRRARPPRARRRAEPGWGNPFGLDPGNPSDVRDGVVLRLPAPGGGLGS